METKIQNQNQNQNTEGEKPMATKAYTKEMVIEAISGLLISIVLGSITAIAMNLSRLIKQIIYPYLIISQTVPIIADC